MRARPSSPPGRWGLVVIVVLGAVVRVIAARHDLFADELATYWVVTTRSFTGVVRTVSTDAEITPPLSFLLSWITTRLGRSPELVRLPALIAGIGTIPLVHAVGLRTVGRRGALVAAGLTAASPFMVFYSAEARGYGVLMGLVLLSTWALLRSIESGDWRWWSVYAVCVSLAAYTHYTSIFILAVQFGWAFLAYPEVRRRLLVSSGIAAVSFLPWLPGLRDDLDSPTTDILSFLTPFNLQSIKIALGHWTIGFPFAGPDRSLRDLPGTAALVMLAIGVAIGLTEVVGRRSQLRARLSDRARPLSLLVLLAIATPVGLLGQSVIGTNVFGVRSLAASTPYLALVLAAVMSAVRPGLRLAASGLLVAGLAIGAVILIGPDFRRPEFRKVAEFADEYPGSVILNGQVLSPGPLTSFEVEGSDPDAQVFRLFVPAEMEHPFGVYDFPDDPVDVLHQAVAAADGGPIIILTGAQVPPYVADLIALLPAGYELTAREEIGGMGSGEARVYELAGAG